MSGGLRQARAMARVSGRVQGVGFRWWVQGEAARLGLEGWVRNLADGRVELFARGPAAAVEALLEACREGPPAAAPTAVERIDSAAFSGAAPPGARSFGPSRGA
ncbi:MAG: acylphosphatase [Pseudomonadota bacterium]